ncbi:hypothetical protein M427DRAFT_268549 [Gonapodya prolifera JEL478]|uniref:Uncharacterized protein n=1 Tax=Gonapodya prolifera (strain JEL478) TaxID=1344416 RepID=A0A139AJM5_GONPJ|nr:hypothetical protein M427DRAFT_268549 [Gonapodya prolifera JEL478]|eukprot:KXS16982.1 hypothetical protein M427DRAFT_268549 [Gonapodya prolifera JEL478]
MGLVEGRVLLARLDGANCNGVGVSSSLATVLVRSAKEPIEDEWKRYGCHAPWRHGLPKAVERDWDTFIKAEEVSFPSGIAEKETVARGQNPETSPVCRNQCDIVCDVFKLFWYQLGRIKQFKGSEEFETTSP